MEKPRLLEECILESDGHEYRLKLFFGKDRYQAVGFDTKDSPQRVCQQLMILVKNIKNDQNLK